MHHKRTLFSITTIAILLVSTNIVHSLSNTQIRREQQKLEARISENQTQVDALAGQVSSLKNALKALDLQIESLLSEIKLTQLKLTDLRLQLAQTREELEYQKQILRQALRQSYMTGDVRTIELVVSSDNFSDFFDHQEYLSRIRSTIQDSATKVAQLEQQLEAQEKEQADLLVRLSGQKALLDTRRSEKNELLIQTRGQQALYEKKVEADRKEYERLQNILAARQRVLSGGSGNYPFASTKCEKPYDQEYPPPEVPGNVYPCPGDGWGYIIRQCTSWAYWRRTNLDKPAGNYWGSAREWKGNAESEGYQVNQKPKKGAIGTVYVEGEAQNHVYIVEDVLADGNVIASQYNSFAANNAWGMYSLVEKTPAQYKGDWFIHDLFKK
jgi:surface antigen/peptidoglycan hydrolase CwlO-like protein